MRTYILLFSFLFCILNTIRVNAQDGVALRYAEQIQQANGAVAGITNTTTGIGTVKAKLQGNGHTSVYTVNGAKVATASASDVNHLLLPAGVYIVKQGNQAKKMVIK